MNNKKYTNIYFIGIGGIGMSALAKYYLAKGCYVAGYDRVSSDITRELEQAGVYICFEESIKLIPENFILQAEESLIVYTPAVPESHKQLTYFIKNNFAVFKRSQVLGHITNGYFTIAIAGTHGKTTITAMIAHILKTSGISTCAFIGGISRNYQTNLILDKDPAVMVVEADEYDRSFLNLNPDMSIITYIDKDHLDIYGEEDEMRKTYEAFVKKLKDNGHLILNESVKLSLSSQLIISRYSNSGQGNIVLSALKIVNNRYVFNVDVRGTQIEGIEMGVPGKYNVENALAAIACVTAYGVKPEHIKEALKTFKGIKRRFDIRYNNTVVYIDDYAHHPKEIETVIDSVRELYPGKKITGIFQPHLFSRTRDLSGDFILSLNKLDELILTDIYPARELPIEGVNSDMLLDGIKCSKKILCAKEDIVKCLDQFDPEILITMGAGDIENETKKIVNYLKKRYE